MQTFDIAYFAGLSGKQPRQTSPTWPELRATLTSTHKPFLLEGVEDHPEGSAEWRNAIKAARYNYTLFSPTLYRHGTTRGKSNVESVSCFVADLDDITPADFAALRLRWQGLAWALYTSSSHLPDSPRLRVVFPLAAPVPSSEWLRVWAKLCHHLTDDHCDKATKNPDRIQYLPIAPMGWEEHAFSEFGEGAFVNPDNYSPPPNYQRVTDIIAKGKPIGQSTTESTEKPGDHFNASATPDIILDLLTAHGWQEHSRKGSAIYVTRVGKSVMDGPSGVVGFPTDDTALFHCWTSSAPPLDADKTYTPFGLMGMLNHGGDFKAAVKLLVESGYGEKREGTTMVNRPTGKNRAKLPQIPVGLPQRTVLGMAWDALRLANTQELRYFSGGANEVKAVAKDPEGVAEARTLNPNNLANILCRVADFTTQKTKGKGEDATTEEVTTHIPVWLVPLMIGEISKYEYLPLLKTLTHSPLLTSEGNLVFDGYDEKSGIYVAGSQWRKPGATTQVQAEAAADRLLDLLIDFPFADASDRANAFALMLTPFLRPYIDDAAPFFIIEAPKIGTGKSVLANALAWMSTPDCAPVGAPSNTGDHAPEEWDKSVLSAFMQEKPVIIFDNIKGLVSSSRLDSAVTTSRFVTMRILGKQESYRADMRGITMIGTGNNALFSVDMCRRICTIRLDSHKENPTEGVIFKYPEVDRYVRDHRAELVADVLVILSHWIQEGRPEGAVGFPSFNRWAAILSGILDMLGVEGFLENQSQKAAAADISEDPWRSLFVAWYEKHGDKYLGAEELLHDISFVTDTFTGHTRELKADGLLIQHGILSERASLIRVGHAMNPRKDMILEGLKLEIARPDRTRKVKYRLTPA